MNAISNPDAHRDGSAVGTGLHSLIMLLSKAKQTSKKSGFVAPTPRR